jgi:leucyl-tRNA synthetase
MEYARKQIFSNEICFPGEGLLMNSADYDGLSSAEARKKIVEKLEKEEKARSKVQYKLRDWVFSRQRYWGEPIPLIHCDTCGIVPVAEDQLPLRLPEVEKYEPTGTGESPLASIPTWVITRCPKCEQPAKRETNTMPQWAGSCWYYLRFCDPKNEKEFASAAAMKAWLPVDMYVGGAEHAVLHLLYARFWHKVLFDAGHIPAEVGDEPFKKLKNQGLILGTDGEKMSKSRGNVINPDDIIAEYGADSFRMYEMFMGPFEDAKPWNTNGLVGVRRFLEKVVRASEQLNDNEPHIRWHKYVQSITNGISEFRLNTCVSDFMKWVNEFGSEGVSRKEFSVFLQTLSPFAPHLAEELWAGMGNKTLIAKEPWPTFDPTKVQAEQVTIAIQVMGKLRATLSVAPGLSQEEVVALAKAEENVQKFLTNDPKKTIFVQDKLVNFVV